MAKKEKAPECPAGAPLWLATYGDMMTLVVCFFVLLFSMSTIDAAKLEEVSKAMSSAFSINFGSSATVTASIQALTGNGMLQLPNAGTGIQQTVSQEVIDSQEALKKMASDFKTYFAEENVAEQVKVEYNENEDFMLITFDNAILFDLGKAELKPEAITILDVLAAELAKYPDNDIKIEGHTDNMPISNAQFPNNWYLSSARAISVASYYVEVKGFPPERLSAVGYGEYAPEFPNDTAENRAKNRRVVMKVMGVFSSNNQR